MGTAIVKSSPLFAVALGGGAALGYAHLGVLEVLEREGIVPDLIVGTSMGAFVGGACAAYPAVGDAMRRFRVSLADPYVMDINLDYLKRQTSASFWETLFGRVRRGFLVTQSVLRDSIVDQVTFGRILRNVLPDLDIRQLTHRFACVSANLNAEMPRQLWTEGSLLTAVAASCAIPGIFPAQTIGNSVHVDGGSVENIPVPSARQLGGTTVVAVSVDDERPKTADVAAEYFVAAAHLAKRTLTQLQVQNADLLLRPKLDAFHWADFQQFEPIVESGRNAAREKIDDIRQLWQDHRKGYVRKIWSWFKRSS